MELQWPLILFTTFIAWSAGLFATQSVLLLRGEAAKAQMPALIVSFVLMVIGGVAVFFHLQHWERIFNGFGHITSGITQELIALVVLFVIMVIYFAYLRRTGEEAKVPRWVAILAIVVSAVLVCVMGHSYMMPSRPAWDSVLQIGSLLGAACGFGPATMLVLCALRGDEPQDAPRFNLFGQIINAALLVFYVAAMGLSNTALTHVSYWFDPTSPTTDITSAATTNLFTGSAAIFTALAVVCALVGVAAAFVGQKQKSWKTWGTVCVVAVFASALFLRALLYTMGISVYPFF